MTWNAKSDVWVISDTHFNHKNILNFKDDEGNLNRPGFNDLSHMNEVLIHNWNSVVKPQDKVYHLGDVLFGRKVEWMNNHWWRLQGKKRLIIGNHDDVRFLSGKDDKGNKFFEKVMLWREIPGLDMVMSHVPLHMEGKSNHDKCHYNVHGHTHNHGAPSDKHICVCVELINYTPVHIDTLAAEIKKRSKK